MMGMMGVILNADHDNNNNEDNEDNDDNDDNEDGGSGSTTCHSAHNGVIMYALNKESRDRDDESLESI